MLGNRSVSQILKALVGKQHYIALVNMLHIYPDRLANLSRYLTASGKYPYDIKLRTPTGLIKPRLYHHHDMLTVNEVFCRLDYPADNTKKIIVDIGSNIGVTALFFLSRNSKSKCYLYEPDERNIEKLKKNLSDFSDRYTLNPRAVSNESGRLIFGREPTGRYGGLDMKSEDTIVVDCLDINDVIKDVLVNEDCIDILKIDTEGIEIKTVEAIETKLLKHIKNIYLEAEPQYQIKPDIFRQRQYGAVCQLTNRYSN